MKTFYHMFPGAPMKKEDFSEHVKDIITIGQFYERAGGEGSHIIFI